MIKALIIVNRQQQKKKKKHALAGSRTRIYCLEGNNADRYTTNAVYRCLCPFSF